jgi:tRNA modification GTPase
LIARRIAQAVPASERVLHVYNKTDAVDEKAASRATQAGGLALSAQTGAGLAALRAKLLALAGWHAQPEGVFLARARHLHALKRTLEHLDLAQAQAASIEPALDLLAEELRLSHDALSEITGEFTPDDLLGEIFSRFCIGK